MKIAMLVLACVLQGLVGIRMNRICIQQQRWFSETTSTFGCSCHPVSTMKCAGRGLVPRTAAAVLEALVAALKKDAPGRRKEAGAPATSSLV